MNHLTSKTIQDHDGKNPWQFSVDTTRKAFYKMLERDDDCVANVFDLVFSELTIAQMENINDSIDAKIWKEIYLEEKGQ